MIRYARGGVVATLLATAPAFAQDLHSSAPYFDKVRRGDHEEVTMVGGARIVIGQLEIRADRAFLLVDRDELPELQSDSGELPRRDLEPPATRRRLSEALIRQRLDAFLSAVQGRGARPARTSSVPFGLVHTMYLEGNVVVVEGGRELGRAESLHFSAVDDRTIMRGAELRLWSTGDRGPRIVIIRGDRLTRQGRRITGRDVSLTTCIAGEPHLEAKLGEIEVIQHENDFEVHTADGTLALAGVGLLPLPNTSFFTRDQTNLPIQGATAGYSSVEGALARIDLGGSFNPAGGAMHRFFTGRDASEFHGDWHVGVGWNQARGVPLNGDLIYGAEGMYRGDLKGFYLNDTGMDRREIRHFLDGTPIDETERNLVQTENRVWMGDHTTLDLTVFDAGDPAVWSEFYRQEYRERERPETSAHLKHRVDNFLFTATARGNLTDFSFDDSRALAPAFTEELPLATFDLFSEQIATLPGDLPVLLTSSGSAGYLRSKYDATVPGIEDATGRLDQEFELATPFWLGPIGFRPFAAGRVTYYDNTVAGPEETRLAFSGGIRAGTRLARSWSWLGGEGDRHGVRHVMSPTVAFLSRSVDRDPTDFYQFDEVDSIDDTTVIRVELLNRLQHQEGSLAPRQFFWLDLAQNITPISGRDNNGHHMGLLEYELLVAPIGDWVPVPNLRFMLEGEHDWHEAKERTFNIGTRFGRVLGFDWLGEYRTDRASDGTVEYGADTRVFGRWAVGARSQYDLGRDETLNYQLNMTRIDHDWRIILGVTFDTIDGDTSLTVNFLPTAGGLFQPRNRQFVSGSTLDDPTYNY